MMQPRTEEPARPVARLRVPGFDVLSGVHEPASVLERHSHDVPTICCVRSGRFTEYYPGKAVDCDPRTLKITPAGEPHWNRFAGVTTFGIRIDVDATRFDGVPEIGRMLDERLFFAAGAFTMLTQQLTVELSRSDPLGAIAAEGLLLELLARMASVRDARATVPRWLRHADDIVHERVMDPLSVAALATLVGVPATRLARAYRQEYGCTIAQKTRQLRLELAARELTAADANIAQLAVELGYYDQSHFTNAFRRHFGVSPGAYRERNGAYRSDYSTRTTPRMKECGRQT
jgi:AraC family transcriptional regulator